ncbi:MAG: SlyX family protein [Kofleriaceae bacterium]|nr:SlyX family protein [Kofleriaceae bacterium]MCL4223293.1 SlyX family protein [Myxococcales bacterium]
MASEHERLNDALIDLEVRVAFQQRTIAELDTLVRTLFGRVDALEKELRDLRQAEDAPPIGPASEPPPHY